MIAVRGRDVRFELRLEVGGIEVRQHLARGHGVALAHVDGIGGLGEGALHRDVLVGRDDAGEASRRVRSPRRSRSSFRRRGRPVRAAGASRTRRRIELRRLQRRFAKAGR